MPYRIDVSNSGAFDTLVALGALDIDQTPEGGLSALMPDDVTTERVARELGLDRIEASPARSRDAGSVWILRPQPIRIGRLSIVPADAPQEPNALRLLDSPAFGTGLHPTTSLCLSALEETIDPKGRESLLDVGTGSGILALSALHLGAIDATAVDIDADAVSIAAANAQLNGMTDRLHLVRGETDALSARWPIVVANILAAPLIEMAPTLVRRVSHHGQLLLSGVPVSVASDVERTYTRLGMRKIQAQERSGWTLLTMRATW